MAKRAQILKNSDIAALPAAEAETTKQPLDLVRLAKNAGCRISFGTDAHGPSQLAFIQLAAASALAAGIQRERVLNFMERDELINWVNEVREKSKAN